MKKWIILSGRASHHVIISQLHLDLTFSSTWTWKFSNLRRCKVSGKCNNQCQLLLSGCFSSLGWHFHQLGVDHEAPVAVPEAEVRRGPTVWHLPQDGQAQGLSPQVGLLAWHKRVEFTLLNRTVLGSDPGISLACFHRCTTYCCLGLRPHHRFFLSTLLGTHPYSTAIYCQKSRVAGLTFASVLTT